MQGKTGRRLAYRSFIFKGSRLSGTHGLEEFPVKAAKLDRSEAISASRRAAVGV